MALEIRLCRTGDLPAVAELYRQGFAASIEALLPGASPKQKLFEDLFTLLYRALPGDLFVLEEGGRVQGYLVALSRRIERLWGYALFSGTLPLWAGRWLLGRYGVPLRTLPGIVRNKLCFVSTEKVRSPRGRYGRILSIALAEECRGRGWGWRLVEHGLAYFAERGLDYAKLEVRPGNLPAVRTYTGLGFIEVGRTRDLQGEWLVMLKQL